MLKNQQNEQLRQIFKLFSYKPSYLIHIADEMERFIVETGEQLVASLASIKEIITKGISKILIFFEFFTLFKIKIRAHR